MPLFLKTTTNKLSSLLKNLDDQALNIIINNASMMSAFTNIVTLSRAQSATLSHISNNMERLNYNTNDLVQSSTSTRQNVQEMDALAKNSNQLLHETAEKLKGLTESADDLNHRFKEVVQRTKDIEAILGLIQSVSTQTNLLSLNAAVEASRAGEHGRGFMVVADEVRKLSAQTDDATKQIRKMISAISSSTSAAETHLKSVLQDIQIGTDRTNKASTAVNEISQHSQSTLEASSEMATFAQEQSNISQEMNGQIEELLQSAQESVTWVANSNQHLRSVQALIGDLKNQTADLVPNQSEINIFKDCAEEMRACNILIKNSDTYEQVKPIIKRIQQIDTRLDTAWSKFTKQNRATESQGHFAAAIKHYRTVRNKILALAKNNDFEAVRTNISNHGKPAYLGIVKALKALEN